MVVPISLYGCKIWKRNWLDKLVISLFHNNGLRTILKIRWQDHVKITQLLQCASVEHLSVEVWWKRWRFIGHTKARLTWLQCGTDLGLRKKRRKTKNDMAKEYEVGKGSNGLEILGWVMSSGNRQWWHSVEDMCPEAPGR